MPLARLSLLLPLVLLGCGRAEPTLVGPGPSLVPGQTVAFNATVRFVPVEGGCWALDTPTGSYEPLALPAAYKTDGLRVFVVLQGPVAAFSICQIAPLAVVDTIRTR